MKGNIRNAKYSSDSGKKVESTGQLSGGAHLTKAFQAKNETVQYTTPAAPKGGGNLGGRNSNS